VGACTPVTGAGSGGRRTIAWGGRRGASHQAVSDRGGAGRGGANAHLGGVRARGGDGWRCGGGRGGRTRNVGGGLEEEEARLLFLEVRNCPSRGRVPVRQEPNGLFSCLQGGANRASPRTGQGAEGRCVHPNPAAFVKGAAGGGEHGGNGERELARRG
jgi:hypothetical protein